MLKFIDSKWKLYVYAVKNPDALRNDCFVFLNIVERALLQVLNRYDL